MPFTAWTVPFTLRQPLDCFEARDSPLSLVRPTVVDPNQRLHVSSPARRPAVEPEAAAEPEAAEAEAGAEAEGDGGGRRPSEKII